MANLCQSLIYLMVIVKLGQTINCWGCTSYSEAGCDDPFDPKAFTMESHNFISNCDILVNGTLADRRLIDKMFGPDAEPYCRKTKYVNENGATIVHRGCSYGVALKDCADPRYKKCISTVCFTDRCNEASGPGKVSFLLIPLILLCSFVC